METAIRAGVARVEITPTVGIPLVGFAGRGDSTEVHDPLWATVLAAEGDAKPALLFNLDLLDIDAETAASFRRSAASATGVPADRIALCCTHTHYGPPLTGSDSPLVAAYRDELGNRLSDAAKQALLRLEPIRLGVAWGDSDIGVNRREKSAGGEIILGQNPTGPVDRAVGVARLESESGLPVASIVNFACHPVTQNDATRGLSADYPGAMRALLEEHTDAPCLFLQGACGDINPIRMENCYEPTQSLGSRLGREAARTWEAATPRETTGLQVATRAVSLPPYRYGSPESATRLAERLREAIPPLEGEESAAAALWWLRDCLERVTRVLESRSGGEPLPTVPAELQAWRLGDLAFATAPAEAFNRIGQRIKRESPARHTFFVGYTNGSIGYVPTRADYPDGGYEVNLACRVDPGADDLIVAASLELLAEVTSIA